MSNVINSIKGIVAGSPVIFPAVFYPVTITVIPGPGCSMLVEYSTTKNAGDPTALGINWLPWPNGTVLVPAQNVIQSPIVALRFTRVSGSSDCQFEVVE